MVKKALLSLTAAAALCTTAQAQIRCATDEVNQEARELHPQIKVYEKQLEADIRAQMQRMDLSKYAKTNALLDANYIIPVVVHVIHDYGQENLSDNDIHAMMRNVNNIFQKRNADSVDIIAPYRNLVPGTSNQYAARTKIEFKLAHRDPQGNPTHGITRRQSALTYNAGDQAKYDVWPPDSYINIWIIGNFNASHRTAGAYAYQPASAASIPYYDGLIGLARQVTDKGTVAHELGHVLSLAHPWGNTNNPEVACGDDAVDDTPPTTGHNSGNGFYVCNPSAPPADPTLKKYRSLWDDTCIYTIENVGRDTAASIAVANTWPSSTSTTDGISFRTYTFAQLRSVYMYPSAPLGTQFTVELKQNGNTLFSRLDSVRTIDRPQLVSLYFDIPAGSNYKLVLSSNPGFHRGPTATNYARSIVGNVTFTGEDTANSQYPFFYRWDIRHGYYKVYDSLQYKALFDYPSLDSVAIGPNQYLVDYPDTVNVQNIMDYSFCDKMLTHGQAVRMRGALNSPIAGRSNLWQPLNLANTGVLLPTPDLAPIADFNANTNFVCVGNNVRFNNHSWNDTLTANDLEWNFSNGGVTANGFTTNQTFTSPGWVTASLKATSNAGTNTATKDRILYIASDQAVSARGMEEFAGNLDRWPTFSRSGGSRKWEVSNTGFYDNSGMAVINFDNRTGPSSYVNAPDSIVSEMYTPMFNVREFDPNSNPPAPVTLNFMYASATRVSDPNQMRDRLVIDYSTNCGNSWSNVSALTGVQLANNGTVAVPFAPLWHGDWKSYSVQLPAAAITPGTFFRLRYISRTGTGVNDRFLVGTGNNFYMDRFHLSDFPLGVDGKVLAEKGMTLAPNPTHGGATLTLKGGDNSVARIQVLDVAGKVVYSTEQRLSAAATQVQIPAERISAKGVYLVQAITNGGISTEKLVVY